MTALTRFTLQKIRMSKAQKKMAMTPVPMRITISTLASSLEPSHTHTHTHNCNVKCRSIPSTVHYQLSLHTVEVLNGH